jgi:chitin synthase
MRKGEVDFLLNTEEEFWKDLIGKYLQPIESDEECQVSSIFTFIYKKEVFLCVIIKLLLHNCYMNFQFCFFQGKIAQELINCRDAYLSKFFMINALFVLIVFLMQLKKEVLHLQWPLGMKYNITYDSQKIQVKILILISLFVLFHHNFVLYLIILSLNELFYEFV